MFFLQAEQSIINVGFTREMECVQKCDKNCKNSRKMHKAGTCTQDTIAYISLYVGRNKYFKKLEKVPHQIN